MNPELLLINQGEALFESGSAAVVEFLLEKCMANSSPERPFGGPELKQKTGETLLEHCIRKDILSNRVAEMLKQQLMERQVKMY